MSQLSPPQDPPRVATADDDSLRRLHFRIWQVFILTVTVLVTAWFCTLGPIPAILALVVAKHILVALLVMGLDMYPAYKGESEKR
jgi:uncharacterized membrane protein